MYIQRRNGGRYYFRIAIPSRLIGYYGRREICLSLGTADRKEAKVKSLPLIQKYLMEFEGKRTETAVCPTELKFYIRRLWSVLLPQHSRLERSDYTQVYSSVGIR